MGERALHEGKAASATATAVSTSEAEASATGSSQYHPFCGIHFEDIPFATTSPVKGECSANDSLLDEGTNCDDSVRNFDPTPWFCSAYLVVDEQLRFNWALHCQGGVSLHSTFQLRTICIVIYHLAT